MTVRYTFKKFTKKVITVMRKIDFFVISGLSLSKEEGGESSKVINVNVIILHSASSPLLHEHLSTR